MQFGSGVLGVEPPVDGGPRRIALGLVGVDGPLQSGSIRTEPLPMPPGRFARPGSVFAYTASQRAQSA